MTEAGEAGFYILRVDGITPPALRPFGDVKADVTAAWRAAKQREGAQALAAVIVGAVADGRDLADGASEWRVEVKSVDGVRRRGNRGDVNDPLADKIFKLNPGQAAMERIGEGFRVVVLKKVNMAPSGPSESRKELAEQLTQSLQQDLDSQLVAALREGALHQRVRLHQGHPGRGRARRRYSRGGPGVRGAGRREVSAQRVL